MKQKYKVVSRVNAVGEMESMSGSRQWELSSYRVKEIKKEKFRRCGPEPGAEVGLSMLTKGNGKSVINCCLRARDDDNGKPRKLGGRGTQSQE